MYRYDEFDHALVRERVTEFSDQVARRASGALTEDEFKPLRLMNGVYLQLHAYMLRVAIPYGTFNSRQMRRLAHIARTYDKGYGHFTTRTNIQYNWPALTDLQRLRETFHVVELYDEQQVVILPVDDELTLLDDVPVGELADEWLLQELDQLPEHRPSAEGRGTDDAGAPRQLPEITDSGAAVELVAAGVGLYVAPMSVARWHHRKDLTYRPIQDLPLVPVVLVWPKDLPEQTEAMVQDFQGIVRGRREGSSRGSESDSIASRGDEDLSNSRDPEVQRAASAARKRSKAKSGSASGGSRTGKGTSRGDQLAGKRLAGGRPRRSGGGRPGGKPKGRGGRPGRGR